MKFCKALLFISLIIITGSTFFPNINLVVSATLEENYHSAVFTGGPIYSGGEDVVNTIRYSGFTTLIIWSIHVHADGTLYLNDELIIEDGKYVGLEEWPNQLLLLKQFPSFINRIECSIGAWGCADFENIEALIASQGTGSDSILYQNFHVLKEITGADAIDYDDESNYDFSSTYNFSLMMIDMGYQVSLCPYSAGSFWSRVYTKVNEVRPGAVDRVYLQCYAGGAGNDPKIWNDKFEGLSVSPGLWCAHGSLCRSGDTPERVHEKISNWNETTSLSGAFMWLFDDMLAYQKQYAPYEYARAINLVFNVHNEYSEWNSNESVDIIIIIGAILITIMGIGLRFRHFLH